MERSSNMSGLWLPETKGEKNVECHPIAGEVSYLKKKEFIGLLKIASFASFVELLDVLHICIAI